MFYDSDRYELSTGTEIDELLSDLPLDLLRENIKEQIENPLSTTTNYLNTVLEKYELLKNNFSENPDTLSQLNGYMDDFFQFIIDTLNNTLNLGINPNLQHEELYKMSDALYNYFVINYRKNIVKFFYTFIKNNKRLLSDQYEKMGKKKDVTTLNYKKQLKNKDDVIILSNIPSIIDFIRDLNTRAEDFVSLTASDNTFDGRYVKYLMQHGEITGDFVDTYLNIIFDDNDHVLDEIQVDVKMKLLSKIT